MVTLGPRDGDALDHVGVEGALGEEAASASLLRLVVEDVDERGADGLALGSGSVTPSSASRNSGAGVAVDERDVVVVAEQVDHLLGLALAQQAGVDEDAGELVADGPCSRSGGDGGIDAAGEAADDAGRSRPGPGSWRSPGRGRRAIVQSPVRPADAEEEVPQQDRRRRRCGPPRGGTGRRR